MIIAPQAAADAADCCYGLKRDSYRHSVPQCVPVLLVLPVMDSAVKVPKVTLCAASILLRLFAY
jgi:hypothetical protein